MANEHEGVSPAGAHHGVAGIDYGLTVRPAIPEPFRRMFWVASEDIANVIGCTVVEGEPRGYGGPDPRDTDPGKLREIANALHALLGEEDCTERAVTLGHLWYLVRLVAGLLDAISDRNRPGPPKPDPRDAEIERLRAQVDELAGIRVALFAEVRQALAERDEARVEMARLARCYDAVTARADSTEAERDDYAGRLRDTDAAYAKVTAERDRLRQESGSLFRKLCAALDVNPAGETWASFVTRVGALVGERDEAREEWKRADAERYRLRQELDDIRPRVVGIARALGLSASEEGVVKQWISRSVSDPAEPRRWVAGDPEPEVGTTVGCGDGNYYTRRDDGIWYRSSDSAGYSWKWLTGRREHLPLVEVVNSDGD